MRATCLLRSGALVLALLMVIGGCGKKQPSKKGPKSEPPAKAAQMPEPDPGATGFIDRTDYAGFNFINHTGKANRKDFIVEAKGGGALCLDYNRDGKMDLYVIDGNTYSVDKEGNVISRTTTPDAHNRLLRNDGNWHFTDVTAQAGVGDKSYGFGGAVGDYDNDGWPDIYVCNWGKNILYHNNGDGTFTDVTDKAGVGGASSYYSTCATFLDADGDGYLDLYVSNYNDIGAFIKKMHGRGRTAIWRGLHVYAGPNGIEPVADRFYHNNGDGTFTDETKEVLRNQVPEYAFQPVAGDFDNDGDEDIYVANDTVPNTLWVNDGTGHFTDEALKAGLQGNASGLSEAGMGNDSADYNQDGWPDIYVTNFARDQNTLYQNQSFRTGGSPFFVDVTEQAGLAEADWLRVCWGTKFQDFNDDGYMDIFVVAGHVYKEVDRFQKQMGTTYDELPTFWLNEGPPKWKFKDVSDSMGGPGMQIKKAGRAAVFADFDNDGDIDVFESGLNERPLLLENRVKKSGNWFMLSLEGKQCNRDALGAKVTVIAGGGKIKQMQEMRVGASFMASNDPRLHWGVGENAKVDKLIVVWPQPGRNTQTFTNLAANHLYHLVEGGKPTLVR